MPINNTMGRIRAQKYRVFAFLFILIGIVFWELSVRALKINIFVLPPPSSIISAFFAKGPFIFLGHLWVTTAESVAGFLLGTGVGFGLAIVLTYSAFFRNAFTPILVYIQTVPKIALAPIIVVWFGLGFSSKLVITFLLVFFTQMVNSMAGMLIASEMECLARSFKASKWQIMRGIRIPHSLPSTFAGMKIGATLAVIGAVVAEFVGSEAGLGWLIMTFQQYLDMPSMFVAILLLGALGYVFFQAIAQAEKIAIPWYLHT